MNRLRASVRGAWTRLLHGNPRWVLLLAAGLFLALSVRFCTATRGGGQPQIRVSTDGRYYWAQLTSLALDRDLDFENQYARPRIGNYLLYDRTETGKLSNPFAIGPAVLWMPFFAVGHGAAVAVGAEQAEQGTSFLEMYVTLYSSLLFLLVAAALGYALARRLYGPGAAFAGAFAGALCGPLLHYAINQPSYSHVPSALCVSAILYLWWTRLDADGRGLKGWAGLGALIGLAMLVRPQNLIFAGPAVVEGGLRLIRAARRGGVRDLARAAAAPLAGAAVATAVFFPQMLVWKSIYGQLIGVPQGQAYMQWGESLWSATLFSSRNGLFPYSPLWALGCLGLIPVTRRRPALGAALIGTLVAMAYVNGAVSDWFGGGSFGGRRYDGLLVHVTLGVAACARAGYDAIARNPRRAAALAIGAVLAGAFTCTYNIGEDIRLGRINPGVSRDSLVYYDSLARRAAREVWRFGNPLSWPAAWSFSLRTGAPPRSYDRVVGAHFLTDYQMTAYRKVKRPMPRDKLRFGVAKHRRFLVSGFGEAEGKGWRAVAPALGSRARALVPLNYPGPVRVRLSGFADAAREIELRWNGEVIARAAVGPGERIDLSAELAADQVERGVNIVDIVHPGVAESAVAARYRWLGLEEIPIDGED